MMLISYKISYKKLIFEIFERFYIYDVNSFAFSSLRSFIINKREREDENTKNQKKERAGF